MAIFNSYVKLPEGKSPIFPDSSKWQPLDSRGGHHSAGVSGHIGRTAKEVPHIASAVASCENGKEWNFWSLVDMDSECIDT
jgi:hypothetical protein